MKLQSYLAATAFLAGTTNAIIPGMGGPPKRPDGKPAPVPNWKWTDPFNSPVNKQRLSKYHSVCSHEKTFFASEFLLDDLSEKPPRGILGYREGLKKVFSSKEYPGSWDGIDPHGYDRNLLLMNYTSVPLAVREWIEDQEREGKEEESPHKGLFAVFLRAEGDVRPTETVKVAASPSPIPRSERTADGDKVVIFAPGALYETLPLWVAEASGCDLQLLDTNKYSPRAADDSVVAYPIRHTRAKRRLGVRDMEFTIRADLLKLKTGEKADEEIDAPPVKKEEVPKTEKTEEKKEEPKVEEKVEEKKSEAKKEEPKTEEKKEEKTEKDEL